MSNKKLVLKREHISNLNNKQMNHLYGGTGCNCGCTCCCEGGEDIPTNDQQTNTIHTCISCMQTCASCAYCVTQTCNSCNNCGGNDGFTSICYEISTGGVWECPVVLTK